MAESGKRSGHASCSVWRTWFATLGPTSWRRTDGAIGRPSRRTASSVSSTVFPWSSASVITDPWRPRSRLTTNPGASRTSTPRLRSFPVTSHAVASVTSFVCGVRTSSTSGSTATGLKKCMPDDALRVLEVGAHLRHGERRRVRRQDRLRRDDPLELGEDLLLHRHLLEHGLENEVAAGEDLPAGAARDERAEEARLPLAQAALADELVQLAAIQAMASSTCSCVRSRRTTGTSSRRSARSASWRAISPAPTIPSFCTRRGSARPGSRPRASRGARQVERVDRCLRLRAGEELRERVLLGAVALLERPRRGAFDEVERAVGSGRGAVHLAVERERALRIDLGHVAQVGGRPPLPGALLDLLEQQRERLVEELDRLEERVGEPLLERLLRVQHPVLAERVLDDERHGLLGADELRDELRAAPARDQPEQHLRAREVADVGGDRAVVAVERDLDSSAERGAVDRRERRRRGGRGSGRRARGRPRLPRAPARARSRRTRRCPRRRRRRTACR